MPWSIVERGCKTADGASGNWTVIKDSDQSQVGCHKTREDAEKHIAALESSEANKMHKKNWRKPFIKIEKEEQQIVKGIVYEPDVVDTDDEKASAETIERACHKFNVLHRRMKVMHREERKDILLLESYINPVSYEENGQNIRKGAWMIVVKVLDEILWNDIKTGKFTGFSMGGRAATAS